MEETDELVQLIECTRDLLLQSSAEFGMNSEYTISISQLLDELILEYQLNNKGHYIR